MSTVAKMRFEELVDAAKRNKGSKGEIAKEFGFQQSRIGDWIAKRRKPEAAEIAILAEMAGWPILETVAEIEMELNDKYKDIWKKAMTEWRAQRDSNPRPLPSEVDFPSSNPVLSRPILI